MLLEISPLANVFCMFFPALEVLCHICLLTSARSPLSWLSVLLESYILPLYNYHGCDFRFVDKMWLVYISATNFLRTAQCLPPYHYVPNIIIVCGPLSWCSRKFAEWKGALGWSQRNWDNRLFWLLKAQESATDSSSLYQAFQHLNPLKFCQDRSPTKQQRGGNALSICYCQSGNMTLTQCNLVNLADRCSSSVPRHLHCNFTIRKTPVIGRGWNIWMLQTLSTGCLYHHLQNRCTRNESFLSSRNPGWQQNKVFNPRLRVKQGLSGVP